MNAVASINENQATARRSIAASNPEVFAEIYQDDTNIVIWQRQLFDKLTSVVDDILQTQPGLQTTMAVNAESAYASIHAALGATPSAAVLSEDIAELVDMFCCLFDLKSAGLRLTALDRAMCPKFHVDRIPCRLVTTYQGVATEWLPHHLIDRSKLGLGSQGKPDEESGLFQNTDDIHRLNQGDVALLKGEGWQGNEGAGLVHRSPLVSAGQRRLLLTLDFIMN